MAIKDFFKRWTAVEYMSELPEKSSSDRKVQVSVCALMVEMARIDKVFTQDELVVLYDTLADRFGLNRDAIAELIADAEAELNASLDLWQFAKTINDSLSTNEKINLVETLWRVVLVDGHMDEHEHYLMSKMKNLLRLDQQQMNTAKDRARGKTA